MLQNCRSTRLAVAFAIVAIFSSAQDGRPINTTAPYDDVAVHSVLKRIRWQMQWLGSDAPGPDLQTPQFTPLAWLSEEPTAVEICTKAKPTPKAPQGDATEGSSGSRDSLHVLLLYFRDVPLVYQVNVSNAAVEILTFRSGTKDPEAFDLALGLLPQRDCQEIWTEICSGKCSRTMTVKMPRLDHVLPPALANPETAAFLRILKNALREYVLHAREFHVRDYEERVDRRAYVRGRFLLGHFEWGDPYVIIYAVSSKAFFVSRLPDRDRVLAGKEAIDFCCYPVKEYDNHVPKGAMANLRKKIMKFSTNFTLGKERRSNQ